MGKRFVTGIVVGTLFGRTAIRITTRVIPKSVRNKMYDKTLEKTTEFTIKRIEGAMNFFEEKMLGETREEINYRRSRR